MVIRTSSINLTRKYQCTLHLWRLENIRVRLRLVVDKEFARINPAENKIARRTDGVTNLQLLYEKLFLAETHLMRPKDSNKT